MDFSCSFPGFSLVTLFIRKGEIIHWQENVIQAVYLFLVENAAFLKIKIKVNSVSIWMLIFMVMRIKWNDEYYVYCVKFSKSIQNHLYTEFCSCISFFSFKEHIVKNWIYLFICVQIVIYHLGHICHVWKMMSMPTFLILSKEVKNMMFPLYLTKLLSAYRKDIPFGLHERNSISKYQS